MLAVVLKIKIIEIVLAGVPDVALPGAHTIHPIAMKLSEVFYKHARGGFGNLKN